VKKSEGRRASNYDRPALMDEIVDRVSKGETLRAICREPGKPSWSVVYQWMDEVPEFSTRFAQARARGFDAIAAECLEIADDATNDFMDKRGADGDVIGKQLDAEHVQRSKLRIETRLKLLAKWDPKRYGEKLAIGGADDLPPIRSATDEQLDARIRALQEKVAGK